MPPQVTSLQIFFSPEGSGLTGVSFITSFFYMCKKESNGMMTVYIPGFNICFPAKNHSEADKYSKNAIATFVKYHIRDDDGLFSANTVIAFMRKLKAMGFTPSDRSWNSFINGNALNGQRMVNPKVKIPKEFAKLERSYEQLTIAA